jgi:hypothetical protein
MEDVDNNLPSKPSTINLIQHDATSRQHIQTPSSRTDRYEQAMLPKKRNKSKDRRQSSKPFQESKGSMRKKAFGGK